MSNQTLHQADKTRAHYEAMAAEAAAQTQRVARRVIPYMQTERFPTRSAIETVCTISGAWRLTGIFDTEESAHREVARRNKVAREVTA